MWKVPHHKHTPGACTRMCCHDMSIICREKKQGYSDCSIEEIKGNKGPCENKVTERQDKIS